MPEKRWTDEKTERTTNRRKQDGYRTNIADRGSSNPQCVTAIREGSNAAGKTPDRNGGADVLNLDVSHFGKTACRLFRKQSI